MESRTRSDSALVATLDVVLSTLGTWLAVFLGAAVANELLGWAGAPAFPFPFPFPLPDSILFLCVGVVALGGAYPLTTGDWSLGRLGEFVFALTACTLLAGVLGMVVIVVSGLTLSGENPLPQATMVALGYLGAYLLVYGGGYARVKRVVGR